MVLFYGTNYYINNKALSQILFLQYKLQANQNTIEKEKNPIFGVVQILAILGSQRVQLHYQNHELPQKRNTTLIIEKNIETLKYTKFRGLLRRLQLLPSSQVSFNFFRVHRYFIWVILWSELTRNIINCRV